MKIRTHALSAALSLCLACTSTGSGPKGAGNADDLGNPGPPGGPGTGRDGGRSDDAGAVVVPDGGTADLSTQGPPPQNYVAGGISLTEIQFQAGTHSADVWSVKAVLHDPAPPVPTQTLGECTITDDSVAPRPSASLDAGGLTISGGPGGDVLLDYIPTLGIYAENLPEPTDDGGVTGPSAPLFTATSQLRVEAGGGTDVKSISGMWRGVSSLKMRAPLSLSSLPATGGLPLSWTADGAPGTTVQVLLLSDHGLHVTCASADTGSYTVPQNVLGKVPKGALTLTVSRVYGASAQTDKGPLHLESRSSWQITTRQN